MNSYGWGRFRYEVGLLLIGAISAGLYLLTRLGQLYPPYFVGVIRNQFGDFCAVPLGTITLLLLGAGAIRLLRHVRHIKAPPIALKWKLLAPAGSSIFYLGNEIYTATGAHFPLLGQTFDRRDIAAICIGGIVSAYAVRKAHQASAQATWQPNRRQWTAARRRHLARRRSFYNRRSWRVRRQWSR